tara:strand:- start:3084 stop:3269 length:186 start_codon:yes stop_codon:yes gene_type:complete
MDTEDKIELIRKLSSVSDQELAEEYQKVLDELLSDPNDFNLEYTKNLMQVEIVNRWLYEQG